MSFARDYNESDPIDHSLNRNWPDEVRDVKEDVADRLATIVSGFVSGESATGILNLPFIAGSAPSTVTDQIQMYGKVVSTKTELHLKDEDGTERQMTTGGKLNAAILGGVYAAPSAVSDLVNILPYIYPVGIVITLGVSTNPATLFGFGTWTAIAGKVIVGIDAGQTEFDTLDETGGEKTHTLTTDEIPAHTHSINLGNADTEGTRARHQNLGTSSQVGTSGSAGGGGAHNNLQPYIVKYVWQRTA